MGEDNSVEDTLEGAFSYSLWVNTTQTVDTSASTTFHLVITRDPTANVFLCVNGLLQDSEPIRERPHPP